jgi:hypothetical protein
MDGRERFLLVPLDIGEEDDVDILVGVATKHHAHAGVDAFLLREHDVPGAINSEPQHDPGCSCLCPTIPHYVTNQTNSQNYGALPQVGVARGESARQFAVAAAAAGLM